MEKMGMSLDDIISTKKLKDMTPKQREKAILKKQRAEKQAKLEAEHAVRRAEKKKIKEEAFKVHAAAQAHHINESIQKLKREVAIKFDVSKAWDTIEKAMKKHGEMESFKKHGTEGALVRYRRLNSTSKALRGKRFNVQIPVVVSPAEIKHHAVYFNAPEEMGDIDEEILKQIQAAMSGHGAVVACKKKGRSIVIFFADIQTRDGLVSPTSANEVTVEIGDHSVKLYPGVPPCSRKRRNMKTEAKKKARLEAQKAAIAAKKEEASARATGQPFKKLRAK